MKSSHQGRDRGWTALRWFVVAILIAASLTTFASSASAAGGEQGVLLMKGPGSVYAGPESLASLSVAAGTAASFGFEVKNTGPATAQFNIQVTLLGETCSSPCPPTTVVQTGSLIVTQLARGPNGYFTAPIAPGGIATYTLKVTPNKTGTMPGDYIVYDLQLADTAGASLGYASRAFVNITRSKGTTSADQFVSASGTPPTSGKDQSAFGMATAASVGIDKTFTFSVKLMNDGLAPTQIPYELYEEQPCQAYFPIKVTQPSGLGSIDVSTAVQNGSYKSPTLAHGASVTLTVTGTSFAGGSQCLNAHDTGTTDWYGITDQTGQDWQVDYLVFSPAAS